MSTLPKSRIRIAGDLFRFNRLIDQLRPTQINQYEEEVPLIPRFHGADSLQVEVAVFNDGTLLADLSPIAELELVIKPLSAADNAVFDYDEPNPDALRGPASNIAPIVCKRIGSEHFNAALTENQWQSKAADMAHAIITLDSEEAALSPGERWLSLIALGSDGQARTLAAGPVLILGGGATFNALPQPVVKDLRDQAAQSAAAAQQSADNALAQAQQAASSASAAQEQVTLATAAAIEAGDAAADARQIATQTAQVRDAAQQFSSDAESSAQAAQQTANKIGNLNTALMQATADANRSQAAATQAEASELAAAAFAAALNPTTKVTAGGIRTVGSTTQTARFWVPGYTVHLEDSDTEVCFAIEDERHPVGSPRMIGNGFPGGWMLSTRPSDNLLSLTLYQTGSSAAYTTATWTRDTLFTQRTHLSIKFKNVTTAPEFELFVNGASQGVRTPTTSGAYGESSRDLTVGADMASGSNACNAAYSCVQVYNRHLTPAERLSLIASGGQIVPVSARAALELHLPCDDGSGVQLRDKSNKSRRGLLGTEGCDHLKPTDRFEFTWTRVSSGFLGDADRPVLPAGAVIESIIWEDVKGTHTTASLGFNASNTATHVASFTPAQRRLPATLAAGSMATTDRRLYLHMSANTGAVTVHVKGRIL